MRYSSLSTRSVMRAWSRLPFGNPISTGVGSSNAQSLPEMRRAPASRAAYPNTSVAAASFHESTVCGEYTPGPVHPGFSLGLCANLELER